MSQDPQSEELVDRCCGLMRLVAGLAKVQDAEWLSLDVGMGQFKALVMLKEHGRQTVGGLARILKISEPSASLLVDKLVTRELVLRTTDPEDRRRALVALSETGDELIARLRRSSEEHLKGWLGQLGASDLRALSQGLAALVVSAQTPGSGGAALPVGPEGVTVAPSPGGRS